MHLENRVFAQADAASGVASAVSASGSLLVAARKRTIDLFNPTDGGQRTLEVSEGAQQFTRLSLSADGSRLAGGNARLHVWNTETLEELVSAAGDGMLGGRIVALSPAASGGSSKNASALPVSPSSFETGTVGSTMTSRSGPSRSPPLLFVTRA